MDKYPGRVKSMLEHALGIVDDLTYGNYAHNRRRSPEVTPERWIKVYGEPAVQMEERFKREKEEEENL